MEKILIAGGSGMIGRALSQHLVSAGFEVHWLSRSAQDQQYQTHHWDLAKGELDPKALANAWGVINLSGAGIVDESWSSKRKKVLIDSRVRGNELLIDNILQMESPPKVFIGSSAIGVYGDRPNERITEESDLGPSDDFVAGLCRRWEDSTKDLVASSVDRITMRIGLVLSNQGGILGRLLQTMPFGIGSYFGRGDQGASWIHIDDLCRMMLHALKNGTKVYNGVAPNPTNFKGLVRSIANRKGLGISLPVPAFMLKLVMGQRSEAILQDLTAVPAAAQQDSFTFDFPTLDEALDSLMPK